jgi:hypothetical protein
MEKSTTGKRTDLIKAHDVFVDFSTKYIKNWTQQELKKYINQPVVIPIGNYGFFVGRYRIQGTAKNCWSVKQLDGKHVHDFVTKLNAILYCVRSMQNKSNYLDILELDRQLGKLDNDITFYKHTLDHAKSSFKNTIALNRYIDATLQRRAVLNILKKTLISAKYLKFGN